MTCSPGTRSGTAAASRRAASAVVGSMPRVCTDTDAGLRSMRAPG